MVRVFSPLMFGSPMMGWMIIIYHVWPWGNNLVFWNRGGFCGQIFLEKFCLHQDRGMDHDDFLTQDFIIFHPLLFLMMIFWGSRMRIQWGFFRRIFQEETTIFWCFPMCDSQNFSPSSCYISGMNIPITIDWFCWENCKPETMVFTMKIMDKSCFFFHGFSGFDFPNKTNPLTIPSGKRLHNYGQSPFLMGNLTINGHFP
jgi:hypothetical protein